MNVKIYQYKLRNLGLALAVNMLLGLAMNLIPGIFPSMSGFATNVSFAVYRYVVGLLAGLISLWASMTEKGFCLALIGSVAALAVSVVLTYIEHYHKIDALIDLNLFLQGIIIYVLLQIKIGAKRWQKIVQMPPNALDLHISGKKELFNGLVIAPHLEMNAEILNAVDHFLEMSTQYAPLTLYLHTSEIISEELQSVAREAFQMYYQDAERKVRHHLQSQYSRSVWMIVIGITAFRFLSYWSGQNSDTIMWEILGSFAAFSLWKVGDTVFENTEDMDKLAHILIAKSADIQFI